MRYLWNKQALIEGIKPLTPVQLWHKMELSPGQMQGFWASEPSVERLIAVRNLGLTPLDLVVPAPAPAAPADELSASSTE